MRPPRNVRSTLGHGELLETLLIRTRYDINLYARMLHDILTRESGVDARTLTLMEMTVAHIRVFGVVNRLLNEHEATRGRTHTLILEQRLGTNSCHVIADTKDVYDTVKKNYRSKVTILGVKYEKIVRVGSSLDIFSEKLPGVKSSSQCDGRKRERVACTERVCAHTDTCDNTFPEPVPSIFVNLRIGMSSIAEDAGLGVFADVDIAEGARVCVYNGRVCKRLHAHQGLSLSTVQNYTYTVCDGLYIDASETRGIGAYINSAESPVRANCEFRTIFLDAKRAIVVVYARCAIARGDELLTFYEFHKQSSQ